MSQPIKVVHFLNQFFAGVGGEEQANLPVEVRDGAVGPGRALQAALGDSGKVVATVVSGDNYFTEESAASAEGGDGCVEQDPARCRGRRTGVQRR